MEPLILDPTVQVAFIGIFTTMLTTVGIVAVAFINNRRERTGSADAGADRAYAERLAAKDDIIAAKDATIKFKDEQLADCRQDAATSELLLLARDKEIERLREQLDKRSM